jgi:hypothetical protein
MVLLLLQVPVFLWYDCCGKVCGSSMLLCLYRYYLPTLDSNNIGFFEEGEYLNTKKKTRDIVLTKTSHLLVAYLNPIFHFALFYYYCIFFYIAIIPYIAIVDDLAPQVNLISSIKMTPLTPTQHPYIRDLMISIKVFGKSCSGAKNSRMGKLSNEFQKWFWKPWSSVYSTEMFSKWFLG